jgi:hypothetical protein
VHFGGGHLPFEHGLLGAHTGGAQDDDDGEGKIEAEIAKVRKMKVENADSNVIGTLQCIGCCWASVAARVI